MRVGPGEVLELPGQRGVNSSSSGSYVDRLSISTESKATAEVEELWTGSPGIDLGFQDPNFEGRRDAHA
jgi:hypothetical protein